MGMNPKKLLAKRVAGSDDSHLCAWVYEVTPGEFRQLVAVVIAHKIMTGFFHVWGIQSVTDPEGMDISDDFDYKWLNFNKIREEGEQWKQE